MNFYNPYLRKGSKRKADQPCQERTGPVENIQRLIPLCFETPGTSGYKTFNSTLPPVTFLDDRQINLPLQPGRSPWTPPNHTPSPKQRSGLVENLKFHVYDIISSCYSQDRCEDVPFRFQADIIPSGTVVHLLGKLENGQSVCVNVFGQKIYFYAKAPNSLVLSSAIQEVMSQFKGKRGPSFHITQEEKIPLVTYTEELTKVYKVTLSSSQLLYPICDKLKALGIDLFETNVDACQRFMIDNNFSTFGWYTCDVADLRQSKKDSLCQLELDCGLENICHHPELSSWPPYNIMSFDIECLGECGFPCALKEHDCIIQISCVTWNCATNSISKLLFSLGTCDPIEGTEVYECPSEYDLLMGFLIFMRDSGVEFIAGYNIANFDLPYIIDRATQIYNIDCTQFTKLLTMRTFEVRKPIDSGAGFMRAQTKIRISGVIPVDMYTVCKDKLSLSDYKLNTVAKHCLNMEKEDVSYKDIPVLFKDGPTGRAKIGTYCVMDSQLVLDLLKYFMAHIEIAEIGKLAKIPVRRVLTDGQQIRVFSSLLDAARRENYILPSNQAKCSNSGYQGATVIDPITGFYNTPVLVVDFASLYPSIIQAHNLCYSTIIPDNKLQMFPNLTPTDYETFTLPSGTVHFVKKHRKCSLLSRLLTKWLAKRKEIRAQLAACDDPITKTILDKQQLAIKVTCNSVYGFTGVASGMLPCLQIAETITYQGRKMLEKSRAYIENITSATLGALMHKTYNPDAYFRVIYGDTDSLFVETQGYTLEEVVEFGEMLADTTTKALFVQPIKLEAEKTFKSLLMITKKRYVGTLSNNKLLLKGVDLVRKTACKFVQSATSTVVSLILNDNDVRAAAQTMSNWGKLDVYRKGLPSGFSKVIEALNHNHSQLISNSVDIDHLTFTTELSKPLTEYKTTNLPHLAVFKKLVSRQEELPQIHDRIPYVFIDGSEKGLKSDLAEHPTYVRQQNLRIAHKVYFDKLVHSVANIIQCLFDNDTDYTVKILYNFLNIRPDHISEIAELLNIQTGHGDTPINYS
ncbi:DNA polymerase catalytic subunit [Wood mouse herpesvirus]|uniref:DNA polymerase n=1 Tax=Wood mouse herpesvirus TaxID=432370 RepID=D0U1K1_9GAMA|nr:DNA polymerase catalytic subunit [Wood mouse herpesvirus]ACY41087.1 DNA polymerase catalytic subunit [Wood mouse herpesvirus]